MLGNSLTTSDSWSGQVLGLPTYKQELTAARVFEHHEEWTRNHRPMPTQDEQSAALYLFSGPEDNVVHNQLISRTGLDYPGAIFGIAVRVPVIAMAPLSSEMKTLGRRRYQLRWLYPSRLFRCLLLDRARNRECDGSGHFGQVSHQPHDRRAAGVSAYPGLWDE